MTLVPKRITPRRIVAAVFLLSLLAVFGDVLLTLGRPVLGSPYTDMFRYFVSVRDFGFDELAHGNLALWNPHLFSGTPFFGSFQSALLYPPNWMHLVLPFALAINLTIVLHVLLAGASTYGWARFRGLSREGGVLAGAIVMFSGAHFMHVYAGHLTFMCAVAWTPLVFLAVDRLLAAPNLRWCLAGSFAAAMQLLAGLPQCAFITAFAAAVYIALRLATDRSLWRIVPWFAAMAIIPALLSTVQIGSGLEVAAETVRGGGVSYEFATAYSFPPENLMTLIAPGFFGTPQTYWGRWYLSEMCLFFGVAGFLMALYGAIHGDKRARRFAAVMVAVLAVAAMGRYTPVFRLLYAVVPGFRVFRSPSKLMFPATLFAALLAGAGLDALRRNPAKRAWVVATVVAACCLLALAAGVYVARGGPDSGWASVTRSVASMSDVRREFDGAGMDAAASRAALSLLMAGVTCAVMAGLLRLRNRTWLTYAVLGIALLELVVFARATRATFELSETRIPEIESFYARQDDKRVLQPVYQNYSLLIRGHNVWGYDPVVLRRYAEFMSYTQHGDARGDSQAVHFVRDHPLYRMLRQDHVVGPSKAGVQVIPITQGPPMDRLHLVHEARVLDDPGEILSAMVQPDFDPTRTVILEEPPVSAPDGTGSGTAAIVDESTDHLTIEADLDRAAILVITDAYSRGWRAVALEGSAQTAYRVLPANYILRGIPLQPGKHRFRVEYAPRGYTVGRWVSLAAWLAFAAAGVYSLVRKPRQAGASSAA
ncbi:MAG: YfhO family protein [bacterium]|nr:YfhO family protein [bacterium]